MPRYRRGGAWLYRSACEKDPGLLHDHHFSLRSAEGCSSQKSPDLKAQMPTKPEACCRTRPTWTWPHCQGGSTPSVIQALEECVGRGMRASLRPISRQMAKE